MQRGNHRVFWLSVVFALFATLGTSLQTAAHLPIYKSGGPSIETAYLIPDADVSYAIFAEFSTATNRIHFYAFTVEAGHVLNFQLGVPAIEELRDFAPVIVLLGPSLQAPDGQTSEILSEFEVALAEGYGATSYTYEGTENTVEFEPFTQVNMWMRQDAEVTLPSDGTYYLAVAVPEGTPHDASVGFGKYVLAPGKLEEFGLVDFAAIPLDWIKTQQFWGHNVLVFMLPTVIVTVLGMVATWYYFDKRTIGILRNSRVTTKTTFYFAATGGMLMIGSTINQLLLVLGYTELLPEGADYIVIMLQSIGLVLGLSALSLSLRFTSSKPLAYIALPVIVSFAALMVGAGFLVGPVMFLFASSAEIILNRKSASN